MLTKIVKFILTDIWRIRLRDLPKGKSFLIKRLRIFLLAIRGFSEDKCQLRASALTFYSLLSIVPVVAMAFGIAKGFGFENMLERELYEQFPGQDEVLVHVIKFSNSLLENTKGGMIAGIGVIMLFWAVIKVLNNIEGSFNDIWGIKESRSVARKFSDYLSVMIVCPLLLILAGSVNVFINTQLRLMTESYSIIETIGPALFFLLRLSPYFLTWALFTFIYLLMPNTKLEFRAGFFAAVVAGTMYQFVQWGYINGQMVMSRYNAIYGSFAALPLFLIWLQVSWMIVLFGAEFSFAHENVETYEFEPDCKRISASFKRILSLQVAHLLIKNFHQKEKALTANQISLKLDIPIRLVRQILYELVDCELFAITGPKLKKDIDMYQPAFDIGKFTIKNVIDALDNRGMNEIPISHTESFEELSDIVQSFSVLVEKSPENKLLKDI
ncbi:MAG: YihY/virulence factor BrkB family protein [Desulfobacterales bacterium]|nr:YihY/virulence factor BrkB family protein [Desulfobacterales bacterium]